MDKYIAVVDTPTSALSIVASQRRNLNGSEVCISSDFSSPIELFRYLLNNQNQNILFAWRGALKEALEIKGCLELYQEIIATKTVHLLIPDLIGTTKTEISAERKVIESTHGYWVTSKELLGMYSTIFPERLPDGIFHDLPDVEEIRKVRAIPTRKTGLIWVGNSAWGAKQGFSDHKGYGELVKPLVSIFGSNFRFRVIDSHVRRWDNRSVLLEISNSQILIHASRSEGTGLPVLEALGVGTVPITTNVGVAEEVLLGKLRKLIVSRDLESFLSAVEEVINSNDDLTSECVTSFEKYISQVQTEQITWGRRNPLIQWTRSPLHRELYIKLKWFWRYLRQFKLVLRR